MPLPLLETATCVNTTRNHSVQSGMTAIINRQNIEVAIDALARNARASLKPKLVTLPERKASSCGAACDQGFNWKPQKKAL